MTTEALEIPVCRAPVRGKIRPPGSKSITNRALVCAALAEGTSTLSGALDSQDTRVMVDGLRALGIGLDTDWSAGRIVVQGSGGQIPATAATLDCAASGTTIARAAVTMATNGDAASHVSATTSPPRRRTTSRLPAGEEVLFSCDGLPRRL